MTNSRIGTLVPVRRSQRSITQNSTLILLGFASAFFPRFLSSFGAPSIINFAHFGIIPSFALATILTTRARDRKTIGTAHELLAGIFIFLLCIFISAFLNDAGFVNIFLQFMLQAEPFIFLVAIISIPLSAERFKKLQYWLLGFALFNLLLAIAQSVLMPIGLYPRPSGGTLQDNITGVFGGGGGSAANYVSCTASFYFALYVFNQFKHWPLWARILPLIGAVYQIQVSDSKQVFLALVAGWGLLAITKIEKPAKLLLYAIMVSVLVLSFSWALLNLDWPILSPYQNWINRPIWGWDGLAAETKFAAFRIVPTHFDNPLNWLIGIGPGHSVTRLGGWVLRDYARLLIPLGATVHPASAEVFQVIYTSYLPQESTIYFPLFTWIGIWGDVGILGLGAYLYLCSIAWRSICVDDVGKFMMLSTAVFGCILTQMEEPGHMLTVACLLALRWQSMQQRGSLID